MDLTAWESIVKASVKRRAEIGFRTLKNTYTNCNDKLAKGKKKTKKSKKYLVVDSHKPSNILTSYISLYNPLSYIANTITQNHNSSKCLKLDTSLCVNSNLAFTKRCEVGIQQVF